MSLIDLTLGPRPDEPGPPINGPKAYPSDIEARLTADAAQIISKYPQARSALLPMLHLVQAEDGYLTAAGIGFCATQLGLTGAEVTAVATFYSMYRRTPTGRYLVGVCTNTLCAIMGGDAILDSLEDHLGIQAGHTTYDGAITLEHLECNAACDYAPVIMVNWEFFDNQTPTTARHLVDTLQAGGSVTPTRGAPPGSFTDTARTLAGLAGPARSARQEGPQEAGAATLAGLRVAHERDMTAPAAHATPTTSASDLDGTERAAVESTKNKPAPAPSATVPAEPATTETDPSTTDSED